MTMDRQPLHPLVAHCMSAYAIPESALAHDGGVTITVDDVYGLRLVPMAQGWLGVKSRLCLLPAPGDDRDELMLRCGGFAFGMLLNSPGSMVIDATGESLLLQMMLRPDCRAEGLADLLGDFVNALSAWRSVARAGGSL